MGVYNRLTQPLCPYHVRCVSRGVMEASAVNVDTFALISEPTIDESVHATAATIGALAEQIGALAWQLRSSAEHLGALTKTPAKAPARPATGESFQTRLWLKPDTLIVQQKRPPVEDTQGIRVGIHHKARMLRLRVDHVQLLTLLHLVTEGQSELSYKELSQMISLVAVIGASFSLSSSLQISTRDSTAIAGRKDAQVLLGVSAILFVAALALSLTCLILVTHPRALQCCNRKKTNREPTEQHQISKTVRVCLGVFSLFSLACILGAYIIVGVPLIRNLGRGVGWGLIGTIVGLVILAVFMFVCFTFANSIFPGGPEPGHHTGGRLIDLQDHDGQEEGRVEEGRHDGQQDGQQDGSGPPTPFQPPRT